MVLGVPGEKWFLGVFGGRSGSWESAEGEVVPGGPGREVVPWSLQREKWFLEVLGEKWFLVLLAGRSDSSLSWKKWF